MSLIQEIKQTAEEIKSAKRQHCDNCEPKEMCDICKEMFKEEKQKLKSLIEQWEKERGQMIKEFIGLIENKEKHGVIILDVQIVDEKFIKKSLNPTHQEELDILKEDYEIKIKSARIDERNKVCEELKESLKAEQSEINNYKRLIE